LQTYTANILIAINPFQRLPHIYGAHMMQPYKGEPNGELSAHVFAGKEKNHTTIATNKSHE